MHKFVTFKSNIKDKILFVNTCLLICFTTACASNHDKLTLPVQIDASFKSANVEASEPKLPLSEKWWEDLQDKDLSLLIEESLDENFNLKIAWDRLAQAGATLRKENSALFPTIEASNNNQRAELRQFFGDQIRTNWRTNFIARITANYELDIWGRLNSASNAAFNSYKASEEEVKTAGITISSEIALVWFEILELIKQKKIIEKQEELNVKTRELVILRFANGLVSVSDILQQEQLLESLSSERELIDAQLNAAKNQLSLLRGKTPNIDKTLNNLIEKKLIITEEENELEFYYLPPQPPLGIPADLITRRPDVKQALYQVQAADFRVASAVADRLPRIALSAGISTNTTEFQEIFKDWLMNVASNIVGPIFDAGLRASEVDRTKAALSESLNNYSQIIIESIVEVDDAVNQEFHQKIALESLERQLEISEKVLSRIQARYNKGLIGYLDVLNAITNMQNLQRKILTSKRELINNRIALYRALAGSWEMHPPEQKVMQPS